jgi:CheY-like chemotaxis protein
MFPLRRLSPVVPSPSPAVPRDPATRRILLVQDGDQLRTLAVKILIAGGYAVSEARHGEDAMRVMKRDADPFDLVITELILPVMSGYMLGRRLSRECPGLPVLYLSSAGHESLIRSGSLPASASFLRKPYRSEELLRQVLVQLGPPA